LLILTLPIYSDMFTRQSTKLYHFSRLISRANSTASLAPGNLQSTLFTSGFAVLFFGGAYTAYSEIKSELKQTLGDFKAEIKDSIADLKATIAHHREESRADMAAFRVEMRADMAGFKVEMRADMASFKAEMRSLMSEFRGEQKAELSELREDIRNLTNVVV